MSSQSPTILDTLEHYEKLFLKIYKVVDEYDPLPKVKAAAKGNSTLESIYHAIYTQLYIFSRVASLGARVAFVIVLISNIPVILGSLMCDVNSPPRQAFEALLYINFAIPYAIANGCLRVENYLNMNPPN